MPVVEIRGFNMLSVAIVSAVIGALWGLVIGGVAAILGKVTIGGLLPTEAAFLGTGIVVIVFAALGVIIGVVTAFLYNIMTRYIGGIEIEISEIR